MRILTTTSGRELLILSERKVERIGTYSEFLALVGVESMHLGSQRGFVPTPSHLLWSLPNSRDQEVEWFSRAGVLPEDQASTVERPNGITMAPAIGAAIMSVSARDNTKPDDMCIDAGIDDFNEMDQLSRRKVLGGALAVAAVAALARVKSADAHVNTSKPGSCVCAGSWFSTGGCHCSNGFCHRTNGRLWYTSFCSTYCGWTQYCNGDLCALTCCGAGPSC